MKKELNRGRGEIRETRGYRVIDPVPAKLVRIMMKGGLQ